MRDGPVRRFIKSLARARYCADLALARAILRLHGEPAFELRGQCRHCGACCETPMIQVSALGFHLRSWRWLFLTWQREVNGFVYLGDERIGHLYTFRCTHWDPISKRCDSYDSRPGLCRDYPRNLLFCPAPEFLPGCGHYAFSKNAESIRQGLAELHLSPAQLAEVERRFYVRDEPAPSPQAAGNGEKPAVTGKAPSKGSARRNRAK